MAGTDGKHDLDFGDRGSTSAARLAIYCLLSVGLMVADHHGQYLVRVRETLGLAAYPLYQVIHWPLDASESAVEAFTERQTLIERVDALQEQWLLAQARLNKLDALESENLRLRALLDSSPRLGERVVVAELIEIDLDPFTHRVALNRGTRDGVFEGQPVADAGGILGQVERVSRLTAFVRLITDPSHAIPVTVNRTGLRTIAYGTGHTDRLKLQDIPRSADVRPGDLLVTSGLGGRFPAGFPVGIVEETQRDPGNAFVEVQVRPTAAIDRSREVLLVWPEQHETDGPGEDPSASDTPADVVSAEEPATSESGGN